MWRCSSCNSPDVEKLDWVDMNSKEDLDDDLDEFYCRSCGTQVDVYYEIDDEDGDATVDVGGFELLPED